jgi:acetylornithine/succinyldiaminopimelate/putrescine aminotransferase
LRRRRRGAGDLRRGAPVRARRPPRGRVARALAQRLPGAVSNPRGRGLLAAVDLTLTPAAWKRLAANLEARRLHLFASQKRGTAVVAPPYVIGEEEMASGLASLATAIENAHRGDGD